MSRGGSRFYYHRITVPFEGSVDGTGLKVLQLEKLSRDLGATARKVLRLEPVEAEVVGYG